jgi:hypothetical protein
LSRRSCRSRRLIKNTDITEIFFPAGQPWHGVILRSLIYPARVTAPCSFAPSRMLFTTHPVLPSFPRTGDNADNFHRSFLKRLAENITCRKKKSFPRRQGCFPPKKGITRVSIRACIEPGLPLRDPIFLNFVQNTPISVHGFPVDRDLP